MINIIKIDFLINTLTWIYTKDSSDFKLACCDKDTSNIHILNGKGDNKPLTTISKLHSVPVGLIKYNHQSDIVVSIDQGGMVEYWRPDLSNDGSGFSIPTNVTWKFKSDTDLYEFKKSKAPPTSLSFSQDCTRFVTFGFVDRVIRVFNFDTGKLIRKFNESLQIVQEMQQAGTNKIDAMEFGRRLAVDREIEKIKGGQTYTCNVIFDETGNFILYPTMFGIKILNITTNKVVRLLGKTENQRFMNIALYQGAPKKKALLTMAMASSENTLVKDSERRDPTLVCTAFKQNRFYLFSQREPDRYIFLTQVRMIRVLVVIYSMKSLPARNKLLQLILSRKFKMLLFFTQLLAILLLNCFPNMHRKQLKTLLDYAKTHTSTMSTFIELLKAS